MTYFVVVATGRDLEDAWGTALEEARRGHPDDEHPAGTMADKHEYVLIDEPARPLDEAIDRAVALLDADDDRIVTVWHPAGAVPVSESITGRRAWVLVGWTHA
ncbi:hypothetical protein [Embleya sp. NPDC059237]|uniref:hypothetical protein n=1 Tax=Embleya sp. NPDC059237 TaxID=3346784 RepID=UPI0036908D0F